MVKWNFIFLPLFREFGDTYEETVKNFFSEKSNQEHFWSETLVNKINIYWLIVKNSILGGRFHPLRTELHWNSQRLEVGMFFEKLVPQLIEKNHL